MRVASQMYPDTPATKVSYLRVFAVVGGPLAWFAELNIGYALANGPCFAGSQRLAQPPAGLGWTSSLLPFVLAACALIAVAAFAVALDRLRHFGSAPATPAAARAGFAALWGALMGGGFFIATVATAAGLILLPRCGG